MLMSACAKQQTKGVFHKSANGRFVISKVLAADLIGASD